jgi:hypothetical protein
MRPTLILLAMLAALVAVPSASAMSLATAGPGQASARVYVNSYVVVSVRNGPTPQINRHHSAAVWTASLTGPVSRVIVPLQPGGRVFTDTLPSGWYVLTVNGENCGVRAIVTQPRVGMRHPLP